MPTKPTTTDEPHIRLQRALDTIGWSASTFADHADVADRVARRWCVGALPVAPSLLAWVEKLAALHEANPAPEKPDKPT